MRTIATAQREVLDGRAVVDRPRRRARAVPGPRPARRSPASAAPRRPAAASRSARSALVRLKVCLSRPRPPTSIAAPSTSRMLPMIEPMIEALTTSCRPWLEGEEGDDQLRRVAEGDVEQAADPRARARRQLLGGAAHQRRRGNDAQRRRREDHRRPRRRPAPAPPPAGSAASAGRASRTACAGTRLLGAPCAAESFEQAVEAAGAQATAALQQAEQFDRVDPELDEELARAAWRSAGAEIVCSSLTPLRVRSRSISTFRAASLPLSCGSIVAWLTIRRTMSSSPT